VQWPRRQDSKAGRPGFLRAIFSSVRSSDPSAVAKLRSPNQSFANIHRTSLESRLAHSRFCDFYKAEQFSLTLPAALRKIDRMATPPIHLFWYLSMVAGLWREDPERRYACFPADALRTKIAKLKIRIEAMLRAGFFNTFAEDFQRPP